MLSVDNRISLPYLEVLHVGFMKKPCGENLVICSCVSDARIKT